MKAKTVNLLFIHSGLCIAVTLLLFFAFFPLPVAGQEKKPPKGTILVPLEPTSQPGEAGSDKKAPPRTAAQLLENIENKSYSGEIMDFNFSKASIRNIIRMFTRLSGIPFHIGPEVDAETSCIANQVPWDQALDFFLKENRLFLKLEGDTLHVFQVTPGAAARAATLQRPFPWLETLLGGALLVFLLIGGYVFQQRRKKSNKAPKSTKSTKTTVHPVKAEETVKRVLFLLEVEHIYRQEDISLQSLSELLNMPAYQLSQVINDKLNKTFFELVNHYRVEEVKQRLGNPAEQSKKIIEIAFEAGFNTKTAFNRTFKKYTGQTPSQYRNGE